MGEMSINKCTQALTYTHTHTCIYTLLYNYSILSMTKNVDCLKTVFIDN